MRPRRADEVTLEELRAIAAPRDRACGCGRGHASPQHRTAVSLVAAPPARVWTGAGNDVLASAGGRLHGGRLPTGPGDWTPAIDFPPGWDFCEAQRGFGIDQTPSDGRGVHHHLDSLVGSDAGGLDVGALPGTNHCDIQAEFDEWTELTSVPEHGGVPYGCGGGFPCAPWRTIDVELPLGPLIDDGGGGGSELRGRPSHALIARLDANGPLRSGDLVYGRRPIHGLYDPGPVVTLRLGSARMQWCWICVSLSGDYPGNAGTAVSITALSANVVIGRASGLVASTGGNPTTFFAFTVRCRSQSGANPVDIEMYRADVTATGEPEYRSDVGTHGVLTARAFGRLGYVTA